MSDVVIAEDPSSSSILDAVYDDIRVRFNEDFLKRAVSEALTRLSGQDYDNRNVQSNKQDVINGENLETSHRVYEYSVVPSLISSLPILERAKRCVTKLFEKTDGFLGSFVYIHHDIGVCAYHTVLSRRRVYDGTTLSVTEGYSLRHIASYPFYDLSLYKVSPSGGPFLEMSTDSAPTVGTKLYLAAFPDLDPVSSKSLDEEVLISPGNVARVHSVVLSPFVAGTYACCGGSSGGAVLDNKGRLLGMHVHNLYRLDDSYVTSGVRDTVYPEDYFIKGEDLTDKYIKWNDADFRRLDALTLGRHAVRNIGEKSSFGCFLPAINIEWKVQSYINGLQDILPSSAMVG